jgi:hypothetical protein
MSVKQYLIFCQICNYKEITDGCTNKFQEIKTSSLQKNISIIDPLTKKPTKIEFKEMPKKIKCPKCGRGVVVRRMKNEENRVDGSKTSNEGQQISRDAPGGTSTGSN